MHHDKATHQMLIEQIELVWDKQTGVIDPADCATLLRAANDRACGVLEIVPLTEQTGHLP